jgi:hypothetical protein
MCTRRDGPLSGTEGSPGRKAVSAWVAATRGTGVYQELGTFENLWVVTLVRIDPGVEP